MRESTVLIEKLAFGGNGVCRINGKVCFVPFSCPGDEVRLTVTAEKKSYCTAQISELVVPSPHRVTPPCPLYESCGGCFWQHLVYEQQLLSKQQILAESLWRGARVENSLISATVASPKQYAYRSRVQFKLQHRHNRLLIGFYRLGTHQVEDLPPQGCPVVVPQINQALHSLRSVLGSFSDVANITTIKVESTELELAAIIRYAGRDSRAFEHFLLDKRVELQPLSGLYLQSGASHTLRQLYSDDQLSYTLPAIDHDGTGYRLSYLPGGFSQVNRDQNRAMLDLVRRLADFRPDHQVLDLYCGNGNFTVPIASLVGCIVGIEESQLSITAARENCRINGIENAEFMCEDAATATMALIASGRRFDTVILDPPRSGAADVVPALCKLSPETIIYVSCDPSTLARDCGTLAANGYGVTVSVPLDMFPQTYHIESVTLLRKYRKETI